MSEHIPVGYMRNKFIHALKYEPVIEKKKLLGIIPYTKKQHRCTGCYWFVYYPNHSEGPHSECVIERYKQSDSNEREKYGECMACLRPDHTDIIFKRVKCNNGQYYLFDGDCETTGRALATAMFNIGLSIF